VEHEWGRLGPLLLLHLAHAIALVLEPSAHLLEVHTQLLRYPLLRLRIRTRIDAEDLLEVIVLEGRRRWGSSLARGAVRGRWRTRRESRKNDRDRSLLLREGLQHGRIDRRKGHGVGEAGGGGRGLIP